MKLKDILKIAYPIIIVLIIFLAIYFLFETAEVKTWLSRPISEVKISDIIILAGLISLFFKE